MFNTKHPYELVVFKEEEKGGISEIAFICFELFSPSEIFRMVALSYEDYTFFFLKRNLENKTQLSYKYLSRVFLLF